MVTKGTPDIIMDESVKKIAHELGRRIKDDEMKVIVTGLQEVLEHLEVDEVLVLTAHALIARTAQYN